jgi:hypothetical protein
MLATGLHDPFAVGGDDDIRALIGQRFQAFINAYDQGLPTEVGQRLFGKTGGAETGWDYDKPIVPDHLKGLFAKGAQTSAV